MLRQPGTFDSSLTTATCPHPHIACSYGADALRLYLINSPVVRAEPLRFQEAGVHDVIKDVFLPWFNAFRFFVMNAARSQRSTGVKFVPDASVVYASTNEMDQWLMAALQGLIRDVRAEMDAYRLCVALLPGPSWGWLAPP